MAVTATPIHIQKVYSATTYCTAVDTSLISSTGCVTVATAGSNGAKVERIRIQSMTTSTAEQRVKLFLTGATTATTCLIGDFKFSGTLVSSTVPAPFVDIDCSQAANTITMSSGALLRASTQFDPVSGGYGIYVAWGDY